jgi:ribonuclease Z
MRYEVYEQIRTTYDGPLSLATDRMVWVITKDEITERMAVVTEEAWSVPGTAVQPPPVSGLEDPMTDWIKAGMLQKEVAEAQGDLMRTFWTKYDVPLSDDVKKAYGVK